MYQVMYVRCAFLGKEEKIARAKTRSKSRGKKRAK